MINKRIEIHYTILLCIPAVSLIVSSIAANTVTNDIQITVLPTPLRVFGQLVQQPNLLNDNTQLQQYQTFCNTNPYYVYEQPPQPSITTNTTTRASNATSKSTSITSEVHGNKILIQKGISTISNEIATHFEGKHYSLEMVRFQCSLNGSLTATCTSPLVRTNLISLPSTIANTDKPKKLCQPTAAGTSLTKMHVSSRLVDFIIGYEGTAGMLPQSKRLTGDTYGLYNDLEGNCTLGIGHLVHFGRCTPKDITSYKNTFQNGQTRVHAIQRLEEDISYVENDVKDNVKVNLTQQQFDALVDFTFNEGVNNLKKSKLLKDINSGNCDATTIKNDLLRFTRDGALTPRRNDEANIFNNGVYK